MAGRMAGAIKQLRDTWANRLFGPREVTLPPPPDPREEYKRVDCTKTGVATWRNVSNRDIEVDLRPYMGYAPVLVAPGDQLRIDFDSRLKGTCLLREEEINDIVNKNLSRARFHVEQTLDSTEGLERIS